MIRSVVRTPVEVQTDSPVRTRVRLLKASSVQSLEDLMNAAIVHAAGEQWGIKTIEARPAGNDWLGIIIFEKGHYQLVRNGH